MRIPRLALLDPESPRASSQAHPLNELLGAIFHVVRGGAPDVRFRAISLQGRLKVIWWGQVRVAWRKVPFQKLERLSRVGLQFTLPCELSGREVAGVELCQLPHVECYPFFHLRLTDHAVATDNVLSRIIRDQVVFCLYDKRHVEICGTPQIK